MHEKNDAFREEIREKRHFSFALSYFAGCCSAASPAALTRRRSRRASPKGCFPKLCGKAASHRVHRGQHFIKRNQLRHTAQGKFGGNEVKVDGEDYLLLRADDIYAVIE